MAIEPFVMVSVPHLPTVGRVAKLLLERQDPDDAQQLMVAILDAIADGLQEHGWPEPDACAFAIRFGNSVNHVLRAVRDRHVGATIH